VSRLLARLRATWTAALVFGYVWTVGVPFVLHAWLTRRIDPLYRCGWWGARLGLWLAGIRLEVRGLEHLPRGRACVYMANHQSNVDPPLLFVVLPPRIALIGKEQVFRIPVLGKALDLGDFVPINRFDPEAARAAVEAAFVRLQRGVSFLVFPEGTRSPDGRLQRFKHGVFVMALKAGAPIVPITLEGADRVMRKGKWEVYPGTVRVTIHPAVETAGRLLIERATLAREVQSVIASALPPEQRPAAAAPQQPASSTDDSL
jgi:1-acyl-sn-glycerol-3-phosphate acyltransferase